MNHWEKEHGKARRAIDRAILKECERQIPDDPKVVIVENVEEMLARDEWKERIARAFGRPA